MFTKFTKLATIRIVCFLPYVGKKKDLKVERNKNQASEGWWEMIMDNKT